MKKKPTILYILLIFVVVITLAGLKAFDFYRKIYMPNVFMPNSDKYSLYIKTGAILDDVYKTLEQDSVLLRPKSFLWVAHRKNYENHVYPGHYILEKGLNNNELINKLRAGHQTPVKVIFNNVRTIYDLAGKVSPQIEADSAELVAVLQNEQFIAKFNLDSYKVTSIFLPNTYELYWNTTAEKFVERMHTEFNRFWTDSRKAKADEIGLSVHEVITLASIVDQETSKNEELARIAGVYINRLHKRIRLGADPTVKFAVGDFTIKRVLNEHLEVDSPYNTYKHYGLPPGPISIPSIQAIEAVLNYEKHSYLYFCAREDFSGYHNFAKTLSQHNENARKYRRALNKMRIYR